MASNLTHDIYHYALKHLETHKAKLDDLITNIRTQLGTAILPATHSAATKKRATRKKRVFSPEEERK
jgi:hypothetical protein